MSLPLLLFIVMVAGALLLFGATRASASAAEGGPLLRWLVLVGLAFLVLASIPLFVSG